MFYSVSLIFCPFSSVRFEARPNIVVKTDMAFINASANISLLNHTIGSENEIAQAATEINWYRVKFYIMYGVMGLLIVPSNIVVLLSILSNKELRYQREMKLILALGFGMCCA